MVCATSKNQNVTENTSLRSLSSLSGPDTTGFNRPFGFQTSQQTLTLTPVHRAAPLVDPVFLPRVSTLALVFPSSHRFCFPPACALPISSLVHVAPNPLWARRHLTPWSFLGHAIASPLLVCSLLSLPLVQPPRPSHLAILVGTHEA